MVMSRLYENDIFWFGMNKYHNHNTITRIGGMISNTPIIEIAL